MKKQLINLSLALVLAGSTIVLTGCASSCGVKSTDSAASSMSNLADQLEKGRAQVASVMTALNTLTKQEGDLKKNYNAFKKEVSSLDSIADGARSRSEKLKTNIESHNALWEQELQGITNEDLKQQSTERRAAVMKEFADIRATFNQVSESYKPFNTSLQDLVTYLGADLSPSGVTAASSMINGLKIRGVTVQNDIKKAADGIRSLQTSLGR